MALPKAYQKLFKWFCSEDLYEELQGDLEERHAKHCQKHGSQKANKIYRKEVIKMIRPSMAKSVKPSIPFRLSLFKIHWNLSIRNLRRNKVFSAVTTFGFAAAISISLFLINLIYSGYSLDQQHNNLDRVYRIATQATVVGDAKKYASTPFDLKYSVEKEIPGFELLTHVNRTLSVDFERNESVINVKGIYVDSNFFQIFNFPVLSGNVQDIFKDRNSIILTEETALKLFNGQNPLGQITSEGNIVRAVIESPKNKSHIQFEAISNIETLKSPMNKWGYKDRNYLYALTAIQSDQKYISARLKDFSNNINQNSSQANPNTDLEFFLQPITGMMFKDNVYNEIGSSVGRSGLIMFISLTLLLVAMACFNYTNLSLARALQRTKEVGIRKVIGSSPQQIVGQFLIETFLFSSLGFILGLGIYVYYSSRIADVIPFPFLEISNYKIILLFAGFALLISLTAGLFPALFFSKISPLALFKSQSSSGKLSLKGLRKLLVGVQLCVSMFAIVLLSLIIDQNRSLRKAPLGIQSENLLSIQSKPETVDLLISELAKIPSVSHSTVVSSMPVVDFPSHVNLIKNGMADSLKTRFLKADENFDEVFQPELAVGQFFSQASNNLLFHEVIVSKELLLKMDIDLDEAVGTLLKDNHDSYQIIGVLDQTVMANPMIKHDAALMIIKSGKNMNYGQLVVKLNGEDLDKGLNQIETAWSGIYPDGEFQPIFLESRIESTFDLLVNSIRIISFIGGCVILISILGQLGMALFNAQSRVKEIGIRKVMGAAMPRILKLILKNTTNTIIISSLIALPMAYLVFVNLVAPEVRTPLTITPWLLLKGALALAALVISIVISQTWRVANLNPAKSLRNE